MTKEAELAVRRVLLQLFYIVNLFLYSQPWKPGIGRLAAVGRTQATGAVSAGSEIPLAATAPVAFGLQVWVSVQFWS